MKTLFEIGAGKETSDTLLMEFGQDFCCYGSLIAREKRFEEVRYISFDEYEMEEGMREIINNLSKDSFGNISACAAFSQALLVPQSHFRNDFTLFKAIYDQPSQKHLNDTVQEFGIETVYSVPQTTYEHLYEIFPATRFYHSYTPALKIYNGFIAANQIDIHFTTRNFRVIVKKDQQVHLAQTYAYKTPLDVVYFLLKICSEIGLDQSEVFLIVSGLIDQDSSMYNELHNYFLNLHFTRDPDYSVPENDFPHYYFTSLYNLAACAS